MKCSTWLALVFLLLQLGCRHHIRVESKPTGAEVFLKGEPMGTTPMAIKTWWWPGRQMPIWVKTKGYRKVGFNMGAMVRSNHLLRELVWFKWLRLMGIKPRYVHHFVLIRHHGPAGTWTEEDAHNQR